MNAFFCLNRTFTNTEWFEELEETYKSDKPVSWARVTGFEYNIPFVPQKGMILNLTEEQIEYYKNFPIQYGGEYNEIDIPCIVDEIEYDFESGFLIVYMTM